MRGRCRWGFRRVAFRDAKSWWKTRVSWDGKNDYVCSSKGGKAKAKVWDFWLERVKGCHLRVTFGSRKKSNFPPMTKKCHRLSCPPWGFLDDYADLQFPLPTFLQTSLARILQFCSAGVLFFVVPNFVLVFWWNEYLKFQDDVDEVCKSSKMLSWYYFLLSFVELFRDVFLV